MNAMNDDRNNLRSVGAIAEDMGIDVLTLRDLIRRLGVLPALVLNDLNFYDGRAQQRIADAVRGAATPAADWKEQIETKSQLAPREV